MRREGGMGKGIFGKRGSAGRARVLKGNTESREARRRGELGAAVETPEIDRRENLRVARRARVLKTDEFCRLGARVSYKGDRFFSARS